MVVGVAIGVLGVLDGDSYSLCLSMIASLESFNIILTIFETINSIIKINNILEIRFGFEFIK